MPINLSSLNRLTHKHSQADRQKTQDNNLKIKNLNSKKRPISAVADNIEVRNAKQIEVQINKNIKFNINVGNIDLFFQFDKFQISQCFNNLIKNAVEAVEKIPNPSISINLKTDKNYIYIEIIDNGIGISKEKAGKIFEPYFTTKNKGTGLGLSIVKKIIEDHNGKIKIDKNKQMAGTTSLIIFENTNV